MMLDQGTGRSREDHLTRSPVQGLRGLEERNDSLPQSCGKDDKGVSTVGLFLSIPPGRRRPWRTVPSLHEWYFRYKGGVGMRFKNRKWVVASKNEEEMMVYRERESLSKNTILSLKSNFSSAKSKLSLGVPPLLKRK